MAWCDQVRDAARRRRDGLRDRLALRSYVQFRRSDVGEALADAREVLEGFKSGALAVPSPADRGTMCRPIQFS